MSMNDLDDFIYIRGYRKRIEGVKIDEKGAYFEVFEDPKNFSLFNPIYVKYYLNEQELETYEKKMSNISKKEDYWEAIELARKEGRYTATPQVIKRGNAPTGILSYRYFYENGKEILIK